MAREPVHLFLTNPGAIKDDREGLPVLLRSPDAGDGRAVHDLVARSGGLDPNSLYANLLQCTHFSDTSILAEDRSGQVVGFTTGYRIPGREETLFVWQIATDPATRGMGLGLSMLEQLLFWLLPLGVRFLETTITPGNHRSRSLFSRLFRKRGAPFSSCVLFSREHHFKGEHDDEVLYQAGPFQERPMNTKTKEEL